MMTASLMHMLLVKLDPSCHNGEGNSAQRVSGEVACYLIDAFHRRA